MNLVTGAAGNNGQATLREFARHGVRVRALVRDGAQARHLHDLPGVEIVAGDLAKPESLPLVPYQSLVELWVYGYPGNGRLRSELWLEEYYATTSQKRWELSD